MVIDEPTAETARSQRICEARRLRAEDGLSKRQIAERLGVSTGTLTEWLRGVPPPDWTQRPNAKDAQRERARELRRAGATVPEIARELGVARSTALRWVADIALDASIERSVQRREHARRMADARWAAHREERDQRHGLIAGSAGEALPELSDAEILRSGALIYWCEGEKSKPWRQAARVQFINSDAGLIALFLAFLRVAGVQEGQVGYRVMIHETADAPAAVSWWAARVGVAPEVFRPTTLKHHNPRTVRHNTGEHYHGCLVVSVARSRELYWRIEGIVAATVRSVVSDGAAAAKISPNQDGSSSEL